MVMSVILHDVMEISSVPKNDGLVPYHVELSRSTPEVLPPPSRVNSVSLLCPESILLPTEL